MDEAKYDTWKTDTPPTYDMELDFNAVLDEDILEFGHDFIRTINQVSELDFAKICELLDIEAKDTRNQSKSLQKQLREILNMID
jgi:hypothetical protein